MWRDSKDDWVFAAVRIKVEGRAKRSAQFERTSCVRTGLARAAAWSGRRHWPVWLNVRGLGRARGDRVAHGLCNSREPASTPNASGLRLSSSGKRSALGTGLVGGGAGICHWPAPTEGVPIDEAEGAHGTDRFCALRLSTALLERMQAEASSKCPWETGGLLLGYCADDG